MVTLATKYVEYVRKPMSLVGTASVDDMKAGTTLVPLHMASQQLHMTSQQLHMTSQLLGPPDTIPPRHRVMHMAVW